MLTYAHSPSCSLPNRSQLNPTSEISPMPSSLPYSGSPFTLCSTPTILSVPDYKVLPTNSQFAVPFGPLVIHGGRPNFCRRFHRLRLWMCHRLNIRTGNGNFGLMEEFKNVRKQVKDQLPKNSDTTLSWDQQFTEGASATTLSSGLSLYHFYFHNPENSDLLEDSSPQRKSSSPKNPHYEISKDVVSSMDSPISFLQTYSSSGIKNGKLPSLSIAVIGATGELARMKIFPALFALYYSGFLPENVGIFGYSRKNLTDEELRSIVASTLTCRIDHQKNCSDKIDSFLSRTFYINGGYDNRLGMLKLNSLMGQIEGSFEANRIFYLSVPQEALLDVSVSLANNAQTKKGWNRIIIEKPFGFDALSSHMLTRSLLSKFEEKQIYRIDHLLGKNLIENLTVLRFANLVFQPLWSRTYIRNVQVILSEELGLHKGRYFNSNGIIGDIIHSHILQTIALLAMEPPISLDGEDIRNEKVKLLRSIRPLEASDVIIGQYKASDKDDVHVNLENLTPTYFAAGLFIDNARWDGVPFMIKSGLGLIKHRVEIRIQFRHVPGNLYHERMGHNIDYATNEIILRDAPDEAILVRVNNKIPGLGLLLDSPELNLLYKDKYNIEVPDSYEHLLLDVIDGDSHLFMRSDELAAAWRILTPVLEEIDRKRITPELSEFGGRGPIGAYYLWAKHGVRWAEDLD